MEQGGKIFQLRRSLEGNWPFRPILGWIEVSREISVNNDGERI